MEAGPSAEEEAPMIHIDPDVRRAILSEVVIARLARQSYRDRSMLAPNATAIWNMQRADEKAETIRALGRVLAEIRERTAQREETYLRAGSLVELRDWAPGELLEAYGR